MIRIEFVNASDQVVAATLKERGPKIVGSLVKTMQSLMLQLQRKIVTEKLSGNPLQQRRGMAGLAGSIQAEKVVVTGGQIVGAVHGAGGIHWYGKVHEFGGKRMYVINPVRKKALAFKKGGETIFARYVFHPPLPRRPFMTPAFEEMRDTIIARIRETIAEGIRS